LLYIIIVSVNALAVETLLAFLLVLPDALHDPDETVQSQYDINAARKGDEMGFQTSDKDGRNYYENAVSKLKLQSS
jgi:hypothetical protein